ncbi:MAG TPA: formylmethanofuran dehydrogenase subunit B [Chloroflexi bacterium]|nr:formylmethanofuran dehydrogenase subunit B [Chloroflexota bacterium]
MQVKDVICPFCGCLCDDIEVTIENGKITDVARGCAISRELFLNHDKDLVKPMVDGKEVSLEEAIEEAATILSRSQHPLIYGLSSTTCEAQREAIELAEIIGGNIDSTSSVCHGPTTLAFQMVGEVTCTLGEVKNRADLLLFWGCNPAEAHIRHLTRYSASAKGLFTPRGRRDRTIVVVDVRRTRTARMADIFLQIRPNSDYACLQALRAILKGGKLSADEVGGIPVEALVDLVERMKSCRYGVLLFGMGLTMSRGKHLNVSAALSLVRDLNRFTKFAVIPMRGHFNVTGADAILTWETGYPYAINFSRGYPQYGPGEFTSVDLLARKEVDAALIIASDPVANFPRRAASYLSEIPTIILDPKRNKTTEIAKVVIPTAAAGISAEGTAYRMDGVPLRLKKVLDSPYPSDEEVLGELINACLSKL